MTFHLDRRSALGLSAAGLAAALGACSSRPAAGGGRNPGPSAVQDGPGRLMFIRHAEEPGGHGAPPQGVTQDGQNDPDSLSVRGWTRAGALIGLFDPRDADGAPLPTRPEVARPTTVIAADPGRNRSKRSLQTVTPLAAALNLPIDSRYAASQTREVADLAVASTGPVLVAWRHEKLNEILMAIPGVTPTPPPWPANRYDLIYVLTGERERWRFSAAAQMLLSGDGPPPAG